MGKSFKKSKFDEDDLEYIDLYEEDNVYKKDAYKNRRNKKQHTRKFDEDHED